MSGSGRWHVVQASAFPHEQEALEVLRAGLPDLPPFRAWSNFEFIAEDGSINEVDALVVSRDRVYLVEIKSWRGLIEGSQHTWIIRNQGRERVEENPLLLANRKAKKLKSLLARQAAFKKFSVPFIQPAIFLSSPDCAVALDDVTSQHVYLRPDARRDGRFSIVDVLAGRATESEHRPGVGRDVERAFARAMEQLGLRRRSSSAQVADYKLLRLMDENDLFQDWEAEHVRLQADRKRVRIFTHGEKAAEAEKRERKDMALREYQLLSALQHGNILRPIQLTETEVGPALVYDLKPDSQRLAHFMESDLPGLPIENRLELMRQLAEALQYAHQHHVYHRAISPWTIDMVREARVSVPVLRDWQGGSSSADTRSHTQMTLHAGQEAGLIVDERAAVYAAPEVVMGQGYDPVSIDIFALGALAYALFTGKHPAADSAELMEKLRGGSGLLISEAMDGAPDSLQELVQIATDPRPADRPASVQEFLCLLEQVEDELTAPEPVTGVHPLDARKGDQLSGGFIVTQRLGSGSTCIALAVERDAQAGVLKIAKEPALNERVRMEATVLKDVIRHPNIVKWLGDFEIDGLAAIFMERAGEKTLDQRLRTEGRLSLDLLERFGDELLSVVVYLEREGINHRDIKPVNIGIGETRKRALTLKLFDFSLARTPADNIRAGTPPYLDPFLARRRPPRWDLHAERFAAAMTLYELATGILPSWGDNSMDPLATEEEVRLDTELFDPSMREGLSNFFAKALSRDARKRFDNADEMHLAWRRVFESIDRPTTEETDTDTDESLVDLSSFEDLDRSTRLAALGLSARELNAADRMGATTVGELLDLPGMRMYRNRGIGQRVIRRLRELREQLEQYLSGQPAPVDDVNELPEHLSIDRLVSSLTIIKLEDSETALIRAWLGLDRPGGQGAPNDLPTLREASEAAACSRAQAQAAVERAVGKWTKNRWMTVLRDEIADSVQRREGMVTVEELAARLLGLRGSVNEGPLRLQLAIAVIQAALDAEATRESARFILYRGARATLVIATEQLGAQFAGIPTDRARYAEALARAASVLAEEEPLPSPRRVEESLAAVPRPDLDQSLSAERRLRLAVAATPDVALSSRLELYPVGMAAERALRMGSNALLGPKRLTVAQLHSRIQSRFPEALPLPQRPGLDALLRQAEIPLEWHPPAEMLPAGYAPPDRGFGLTRHTSTLRRRTTASVLNDLGPEAQAAQRFDETLQRVQRDRRVLIVTCALHRMEVAGDELAHRLGLESISVDRLMIKAMKDQAGAAGAAWNVVLLADRAQKDSVDWRRLNALVQRAVPVVRQQLLEQDQALLIEHLGLLARYGHIGTIQSLRDAAATSLRAARFVLVPGDEFRPPMLDHVVLPVITPADWAHMPLAWLENRHRASEEHQERAEGTS